MKLYWGPQTEPVFGTRFKKYFLSWGILGRIVLDSRMRTEIWARSQVRGKRGHRHTFRKELSGERATTCVGAKVIFCSSNLWGWLKVTWGQCHLGHLNGPESLSFYEQPPLWTGDLQTHIPWPLRSRGILRNCVKATNAGCDRISIKGRWEGNLEEEGGGDGDR